MAGFVCPAIGIPCSLATAFIENDRAQMSVNDFRLMFILVIGLYEDGGDERDRYNTSAPGFFRTDRSAREIARSKELMSNSAGISPACCGNSRKTRQPSASAAPSGNSKIKPGATTSGAKNGGREYVSESPPCPKRRIHAAADAAQQA